MVIVVYILDVDGFDLFWVSCCNSVVDVGIFFVIIIDEYKRKFRVKFKDLNDLFVFMILVFIGMFFVGQVKVVQYDWFVWKLIEFQKYFQYVVEVLGVIRDVEKRVVVCIIWFMMQCLKECGNIGEGLMRKGIFEQCQVDYVLFQLVGDVGFEDGIINIVDDFKRSSCIGNQYFCILFVVDFFIGNVYQFYLSLLLERWFEWGRGQWCIEVGVEGVVVFGIGLYFKFFAGKMNFDLCIIDFL